MKEKYDVVIVGTGVAGCFAALHLSENMDVLMITKGDLEESDSFLAQGGICVQKDVKLTGLVDTGGQAKFVIQNGEVSVNGETCTMRGKKLRSGDTASYAGKEFAVR